MGVEFLGLFSVTLIFFSLFFFSRTCQEPPCLSVFVYVCLVFSGWVIGVNSFLFWWWWWWWYVYVFVCVCFFHACYTAPQFLIYFIRTIKFILHVQYLSLSICLCLSMFGWLVGLLVWVIEREREALLT